MTRTGSWGDRQGWVERVGKVLTLTDFLDESLLFHIKFPEETEARLLRYKLCNFLTQEVLRIIIRK